MPLDRLVLQVAVSLGGPIEKGFEPDPYCVEQPIVFALLTILLNQLEKARVAIKAREDYIKSHIFGRIVANNNIESLKMHMADTVYYCRELIDTFHVNKIIYSGGNEMNCRDYFKARLVAYQSTQI